jgi:hypothetical protein
MKESVPLCLQDICIKRIDAIQGRASQPLVAFSTKEGDRKMDAAAHRIEGNANSPVLYVVHDAGAEQYDLKAGVRPLELTRMEGGDRRARLHSESNRANRGASHPPADGPWPA